MKKEEERQPDQQEELIARIESQQQLINDVEKEIYENISQVLCLARIKLSVVDSNDQYKMAETIQQSGNLIAKAIADLRNLAKHLNKI